MRTPEAQPSGVAREKAGGGEAPTNHSALPSVREPVTIML